MLICYLCYFVSVRGCAIYAILCYFVSLRGHAILYLGLGGVLFYAILLADAGFLEGGFHCINVREGCAKFLEATSTFD